MGIDSSKQKVDDEFRNDLLVGSTENILVSEYLEDLSEDVILTHILPCLEFEDLLILSLVCKYFCDVFHKFTQEIPISANLRERDVTNWPRYEYKESKKQYEKYLSKGSSKFRKFQRLESLLLCDEGGFYCIHHNLGLFKKFPIKKLDLECTYIQYPVDTRNSSDPFVDPEQMQHKKMLERILNEISPTLEHLNIANYQGVTGNLFLRKCFEKCKLLNYLIIGSLEEHIVPKRVPIFLDDISEEEIDEKYRSTLSVFYLSVAFTFAKHFKYRPSYDLSIFDPLFEPERIMKLKGLVLYDCSLLRNEEDRFSNHSENLTRKLFLLNKVILAKSSSSLSKKEEEEEGEEEGDIIITSLLDIGNTDRYFAEAIDKYSMEKSTNFETLKTLNLKPIFSKLKRAIIWDPHNFYKLDEHCSHLKVFEGMLRDVQIERLTNQNYQTLESFTLFEKVKPDEKIIRPLLLRGFQGEQWYNTHNKGLIHLKKCTKLKHMEFHMPLGGRRRLLKSGFDIEFMVMNKMIIPEKYKKYEFKMLEVKVGWFGSVAGKTWSTDLRIKKQFFFFWQFEKEQYSHSYGKNNELNE